MRIGIGAHLGDAAYDFAYKPGKLNVFRMQFLLEGGYMPYLFLHLSANQGSLGMGNGTSRVGLGTGFGQNQPRLIAGLAMVNSESNALLFDHTEPSFIPYLQGNVPVGKHWEVSPYAATNFKRVNQFRLQVHYRLPKAARRE